MLRRIVIVGCPAAGKSTLATLLGAALDLPVIKRDSLGELGSQPYRDAILKMTTEPCWILDGPPFFEEDIVYAAADLIVWLDMPKPSVIWWGLKRAFIEAQNGASLMHALHRTGGAVYAANVFAARREHFSKVFDGTGCKAKVLHIRSTRCVSNLTAIKQLIESFEHDTMMSSR